MGASCVGSRNGEAAGMRECAVPGGTAVGAIGNVGERTGERGRGAARRTMAADEAAGRGLDARRTAPLEAPAAPAAPYRGALERLARLLLPDSLAALLPPGAELVVIPAGVLNMVPFAALPLPDGGYLGARNPLRYAPSLASLARFEAHRAVERGDFSRGLVVGNPAMPTVTTYTGEEVQLDPLPGAAREADEGGGTPGRPRAARHPGRRAGAARPAPAGAAGSPGHARLRVRRGGPGARLVRGAGPRRRRGRPAHRGRGALAAARHERRAGGALGVPVGAGKPARGRGHGGAAARLPGPGRPQRRGLALERERPRHRGAHARLLRALAARRRPPRQGRGAAPRRGGRARHSGHGISPVLGRVAGTSPNACPGGGGVSH
jgi:hypothetical protein